MNAHIAFWLVAAVFFVISAVLVWRPRWRLLNFVDYDGASDVAALNRYAAARLLLPAAVAIMCGIVAWRSPQWTAPLAVLMPLSLLAAVVWTLRGNQTSGQGQGKPLQK